MSSVSNFTPAHQPGDDVAGHRYIHVIGASVFVSDRVEIDGASLHFLGMHGYEAVWAVDVPQG